MEVTFLYSIWSITIFSVILIPKKRLTEASIIFTIQQLLSWFFGLIVAQLNLIEYPVREFANVNRTSFTFEFLVFPVVTIFYVLFYPKHKSRLKRFLYSFTIVSVSILSEVFFEKYTKLIKYIHWEWYYSWVSVYASLHVNRILHKWYFKFAD